MCVTNEQTETIASRRARFEQLAMPAVNALYRQAMKLTNNTEDAQDLVQDAYERGFKAFDSFQPGSNFEAWMSTIERNAFFNQYAKAKRRPRRANDSTGEYDDWDIYSASEHASEGLRSAEQEYLDNFAPEEILKAFGKLSPERRQVFIDTAIDGKSYQQVADEQGIKIGTVMSRLNRARNQLKRELASYARERGYGDGGGQGVRGQLKSSPSANPVAASNRHNGVKNGVSPAVDVAKSSIAADDVMEDATIGNVGIGSTVAEDTAGKERA
nr:sigma-70 family RNA polymerase sigma factor [Bifidobacterium sp.]